VQQQTATAGPFSNATTRDCASGSLATRPISTPIRRICLVCARAASGHDAAAPLSSDISADRTAFGPH